VRALILICLVACGSSAASKRETTIKATLTTIDGLSAGLVAYDGPHQLDIVGHAANREDALTQLSDYRKKRDKAEEVVIAAYKAVAAAATLDDDKSLSAMLAAALLVQQALAELGVKLP
jgi:hypothetical protein